MDCENNRRATESASAAALSGKIIRDKERRQTQLPALGGECYKNVKIDECKIICSGWGWRM